MTKKELHSIAENWFYQQGWKPFAFQKKNMESLFAREAWTFECPAGSGKTYALWFPIVLNYINNNPDYKSKHKKGLKAIWITPLRALSHEIKQSAERVAKGRT